MLITGDFNGHCEQWWPGGDSNKEGIAKDTLASDIGLSQLIAEPTNFQENAAPSCIDLFFCDQLNLVIESGTRPSIDPFYKHQIIFCRVKLSYLSVENLAIQKCKYCTNSKSNAGVSMASYFKFE